VLVAFAEKDLMVSSTVRIEPSKWSAKILKPVDEVIEQDIIDLEMPFRLIDSRYTLLLDEFDKIQQELPQFDGNSFELKLATNFLLQVDEKLQQLKSQFIPQISKPIVPTESLTQSIVTKITVVPMKSTKVPIPSQTTDNNDNKMNNLDYTKTIDSHNIVSSSSSDIVPSMITNNITTTPPHATKNTTITMTTTSTTNTIPSITSTNDQLNNINNDNAKDIIIHNSKNNNKQTSIKSNNNNNKSINSIKTISIDDTNDRKKKNKPRHEKEERRRGCPCCDPDNLNNLIDRMMFGDIPPN
jgi:hypothetical protein